MPAAQQFVGDDIAEQRQCAGLIGVAHHHRGPFTHELPVDEPRVVRGPRPHQHRALDLQLDPFVGDLHHAPRAVEEQPPEIGDQAEGVHIDVEFVGHHRKLVHLLDLVELDLIAHQVVEASVDVDERTGHRQEISARHDLHRLDRDTRAGSTPGRPRGRTARATCLVAICRARLWWICSASVLLPELIVP